MHASEISSHVSDLVLESFLNGMRTKNTHIPDVEFTAAAIDVGYGFTKYKKIDSNGNHVHGAYPSIAALAPQHELSGSFFMSRDTKKIEVNCVTWEVGPDVYEIMTRNEVRALHENFVNSEQWILLFLGALAYLDEDVLDYVVLGLPVNHMHLESVVRNAAEKTHIIDGKEITVRNVIVIPQPLGSLYSYAKESGEFDLFMNTTSLVVDPGYLTFDFLVTKGFSVNPQRSDARPGGMSSILTAMARSISQQIESTYDDLNELDTALNLKDYRGPKDSLPIYIYGKQINLTDHIRNTIPVIDSNLNFMLNKIGSKKDIARIVIGGGPSCIFERSIRKHFDRHNIIMQNNSIFSNVDGFLIYGLLVIYYQLLKSARPASRAS